MRKNLPISLLAGAVLILGAGHATAIDQWPDTGVTDCYDNSVALANCLGSTYPGQDGMHDGPARSYTDNSDGTVTDGVTGLMWQQDGTAAGTTNTHAEALGYAAGLGTGGHNDWRLPTVKELATLVDPSAYLPSITTTGTSFTTEINPGASTGYWTSTDRATDSTQAWVVNFANGNVGIVGVMSLPKTSSAELYVRAVRDLP